MRVGIWTDMVSGAASMAARWGRNSLTYELARKQIGKNDDVSDLLILCQTMDKIIAYEFSTLMWLRAWNNRWSYHRRNISYPQTHSFQKTNPQYFTKYILQNRSSYIGSRFVIFVRRNGCES